jgi:hypothetical protein
MSVPDHQIDPPEDAFVVEGHLNAYFGQNLAEFIPPPIVGIDPGNGEMTIIHSSDHIDPGCRRGRTFLCDHPYDTAYEHTTLTDQIMEIFHTSFPQEEHASRWWSGGEWDGYNEPDSHEKRTRHYLETYPWWRLWKVNKKLGEEGLSPTIDHEESLIMIGKSKASAAYIQHNDNFKRFIEELIP